MVLRPNITTTKKFLSSFATPGAQKIAAMIGTAIWGPEDTVKSIQNLSEYISLFQDDKTGTGVSGIKAADLFFRNGGILKFVRIVDTDGAKSTQTFQKSSVDELDIEALYKGTHGDNIGVTITENATTSANRDIKITDGNRTETYTNAGAGFDSNTDIIAAINDSSQLVTASLNTAGTEGNVPDTTTETFLTGGDDGEDSLTASDYETVLNDVLYNEEFDYLLVPGIDSNSDQDTLLTVLENRASNDNLYSRYITGISSNESVSTATSRGISGQRVTVTAPGVVYTHRIDDSETNLDGTYLACAYAGVICSLDIQVSGTRENVNVEDTIVNSTTDKNYYTKLEQEQLLQGKISPVTKRGNSLQIIRDITRYSDETDPRFEGAVVDVVDYVTEELETLLDSKIGQPQTELKRRAYEAELNNKLQIFKTQGIIADFIASSVTEGVSPDTIVAAVSFKPAYNVNFVELQLNIQ